MIGIKKIFLALEITVSTAQLLKEGRFSSFPAVSASELYENKKVQATLIADLPQFTDLRFADE